MEIPWLISVAAIVVGVLVHRRATRGLCTLRVRAGRVERQRGKIPPRVLGDLCEVLAPSAATGTLRVVATDNGGVYVEVRGRFDPVVVQRVRNVLGSIPAARWRAG